MSSLEVSKEFYQILSIYKGLEIFGFNSHLAIIIHSLVAVLSIAIIIYSFRKNIDEKIIIFFCLFHLISPYIFIYDSILLALVAYYLALHAQFFLNRALQLYSTVFCPSVTVTDLFVNKHIPYSCFTTLVISSALLWQVFVRNRKLN